MFYKALALFALFAPLLAAAAPAELAKRQALSVQRDTSAKAPLALDDIAARAKMLFDAIRADMFARTTAAYDRVVTALDSKSDVVLPWCRSARTQ